MPLVPLLVPPIDPLLPVPDMPLVLLLLPVLDPPIDPLLPVPSALPPVPEVVPVVPPLVPRVDPPVPAPTPALLPLPLQVPLVCACAKAAVAVRRPMTRAVRLTLFHIGYHPTRLMAAETEVFMPPAKDSVALAVSCASPTCGKAAPAAVCRQTGRYEIYLFMLKFFRVKHNNETVAFLLLHKSKD
jgi:hypothetical protein